MSEYLWKQYEDLPQGLGYMRFSTEHIITLLVLGAVIVLTVRLLTPGIHSMRQPSPARSKLL